MAAKFCNVLPDENKLLWELDLSEYGRKADIHVGTGCEALYIVDGELKAAYPSGKDITVNIKSGREKVVCASTSKVFSSLWGIGGVPYFDKKLSIDTKIGMNGEFKFRLTQANNLRMKLGKDNVTPADIKAFCSAKLDEILKTELSKQVNGQKYEDILSRQSYISDIARLRFRDVIEGSGMTLTEFSLKEIFFPEEYLRKRAEKTDAGRGGLAGEIDSLEEKDRDAEYIGMLKGGRSSGAGDGYRAPSYPDSKKICPVCGKENDAGNKFCDVCGTKL